MRTKLPPFRKDVKRIGYDIIANDTLENEIVKIDKRGKIISVKKTRKGENK